jgi:hypothetical protein
MMSATKQPSNDESWEDDPEIIGVGSVALYERLPAKGRRCRNNPIGFVHFPDKPRRKPEKLK